MKKIKLLPSIIMLALCLAVLGIGVYSATTGSNTISGTLTVNAAGHEVEISVYKADSEGSQIGSTSMYGTSIATTTTSRSGKDIALSAVSFNSDEANALSDVDRIDIIIAVKNKSSEDIGVYFWNGTTITNNQAAVSNILYGNDDLDGEDEEENTISDIVNVEYSFYHHIPAKSGETYYTEYMHVLLMLNRLVSETVTVDLDLDLNVETYVSNLKSSDLSGSSAYSYNANTFVKIDGAISYITFEDGDFSSNATVSHVVFPYGMTSLANYCFMSSTALRAVSLPITLTSIGNDVLGNSAGIVDIIIPSQVATKGTLIMSGNTALTKVYLVNTTWWRDGSPRIVITEDLSDPTIATTCIKTTYATEWYNSAS